MPTSEPPSPYYRLLEANMQFVAITLEYCAIRAGAQKMIGSVEIRDQSAILIQEAYTSAVERLTAHNCADEKLYRKAQKLVDRKIGELVRGCHNSNNEANIPRLNWN